MMTLKPSSGKFKHITSASNTLIKELRALHLKKYRDHKKLFLAEGLKLVRQAFELGWHPKILVFVHDESNSVHIKNIVLKAKQHGALIIETSRKILELISKRDNTQTIIGVFQQKTYSLAQLKSNTKTGYVALDRVRDPGNLGTILRTCDAVGITSVILIGETTDPFSIETVRATMGSIFSVSLSRVTEEEFRDWISVTDLQIIGTHLKSKKDYRSLSYTKKTPLLLMGNEKHGLSDSLANVCHDLVYIPQIGTADSLNLAVATAVMLYEIKKDCLTID